MVFDPKGCDLKWMIYVYVYIYIYATHIYIYIHKYHGPPKPTFLEVFMVNKLVLRWPTPLFFMVLWAQGIYIYTYIYICYYNLCVYWWRVSSSLDFQSYGNGERTWCWFQIFINPAHWGHPFWQIFFWTAEEKTINILNLLGSWK